MKEFITAGLLVCLAGMVAGCAEAGSREEGRVSSELKLVFVGDSITHGGDWGKLLKRDDVVNTGIPGDTTLDVLKRVDDIAAIHAVRYFIMIGVNDLSQNVPIRDILLYHEEIIRELTVDNIAADFVLQSVLPVNERIGFFNFDNDDILELNRGLQRLAEEDISVQYLDLHPLFADEEGQLKAGYTDDGLHLSEAGYIEWAKALQPYLK